MKLLFYTIKSFLAKGMILACILSASFAYAQQNENHENMESQQQPFSMVGVIPADAKLFDFHGFQGYDFTFMGRNAKVVVPKQAASNRPWNWRARFWGGEPQTDIALLEHGFHLVYCDVSEMFGNNEALNIWNEFYLWLQKAGLSKKSSMEGMSRGGMYIYRWAAKYPDRVTAIYADAPVLDLKSWPGGKGKGKKELNVWETFKKNFGFTTEEEAMAFDGNPVDLTEKIVAGGYPMLHVVGDVDEVVPVEENTTVFEQKVLALGGSIQVIHKPDVGHHPHSLKDPQPIVDFILRATNIPEWKRKADERIEQYRKSDLHIRVTHKGKPVQNASVKIEMIENEFLFGCSVGSFGRAATPQDSETYKRLFAGLFNFATLPFYWNSYEREKDKPQYERTEKIIEWCVENKIQTKGHPLIWNNEPAWANSVTDEELYRRLVNRAKECPEHFRGKIKYWDVINEIVTWKNKMKTAPKISSFGATDKALMELIKAGFAAARKGNPDAALILNDYKLDSGKLDSLLAQLVDKKGKPIYDIIGVQSHMHNGHIWSGHVNGVWDNDYIRNTCERLAKFGKPIHFTEMTVLSTLEKRDEWDKLNGEQIPSTREGEIQQCEDVVRIYTMLFSHPAVEAITWWNLSDYAAWRNAPAGLIRADMSPKPAYNALKKLIKEEWTTNTTLTTDKSGQVKLRAFRGKYNFVITLPDGTELERDFSGKVGKGVNEIELKIGNFK